MGIFMGELLVSGRVDENLSFLCDLIFFRKQEAHYAMKRK